MCYRKYLSLEVHPSEDKRTRHRSEQVDEEREAQINQMDDTQQLSQLYIQAYLREKRRLMQELFGTGSSQLAQHNPPVVNPQLPWQAFSNVGPSSNQVTNRSHERQFASAAPIPHSSAMAQSLSQRVLQSTNPQGPMAMSTVFETPAPTPFAVHSPSDLHRFFSPCTTNEPMHWSQVLSNVQLVSPSVQSQSSAQRAVSFPILTSRLTTLAGNDAWTNHGSSVRDLPGLASFPQRSTAQLSNYAPQTAEQHMTTQSTMTVPAPSRPVVTVVEQGIVPPCQATVAMGSMLPQQQQLMASPASIRGRKRGSGVWSEESPSLRDDSNFSIDVETLETASPGTAYSEYADATKSSQEAAGPLLGKSSHLSRVQCKQRVEFYRKLRTFRSTKLPALECALCRKEVVNSEVEIRDHISGHSTKPQFFCSLCRAGFKHQIAALEHVSQCYLNNVRKESGQEGGASKVEAWRYTEDARDVVELATILQECFPKAKPSHSYIIDRFVSRLKRDHIDEVTCQLCRTPVPMKKHALARHLHAHPLIKCKWCNYTSDNGEAQIKHCESVHPDATIRNKSRNGKKPHRTRSTTSALAAQLLRCFNVELEASTETQPPASD